MKPVVISLVVAGLCTAWLQRKTAHAEGCANDEFYTLSDYATVKKYDAHVHVFTNDPYFVRHSLQDNFQLLSVNLEVPDLPPLEQQRDFSIRQLKNFPGQFAYTTAFSVRNWNDPDWRDKTIAYLSESFKKGAIGVKVWKNIGMELKDRNGRFVMIDDARFDSVLNFIERSGKTVIGHIGEPRNCWLPLKDMTVENDREYFSKHPQYHMYLHPEYPSYEAIIGARDRMLAKHRHLPFVGAHLGSLEWSVDELAKRLDEFPEMAVDLAERVSHVEYQAVRDHRKVYDFFIKYQDRIIYGTDMMVRENMDSSEVIQRSHRTRLSDWRFFTSDEAMQAPEVADKFHGLHLPREVVDKIYRKNAEKWFPGLAEKQLIVKRTQDFELTGDGVNPNWGKTDWVDVIRQGTGDNAYPTKAKVLYSPTGMYFLFTCIDKRLTASLQTDMSDLWNEDVVEVFIQPDEHRPAYFEYELSPLNYELPIMVYNDSGKLNSWLPFHYAGDRKTRHATVVQGGERKASASAGGWTAEFFIPYKVLRPMADLPPVPGSRWKGNLYRIDYDSSQVFYSWSPTRINFHEYSRFGVFAFE